MKIIRTINQYIQLARPSHWIKNLLIFAALIFSFSFNSDALFLDLIAFISFSLVASSIYIINDIFDADKDRHHPKKKHRPIASKKIKIWQAVVFSVFLIAVSAFLAVILNESFLLVIILYFVLNFLYSFGLKNYAIIDVMIVALGFVLRVVAGALAIGVGVSHWLLLCTFFISLFLAFGKRKIEMFELKENKKRQHRQSIYEYTNGFIDQMLALSAGISVVFYSLYTIDPTTVQRFGSDNLIYTTPIVVYAVLRYFHLLYNKKIGGDPVQIFIKDRQMIACIFVWLIFVVLVYYKFSIIKAGI